MIIREKELQKLISAWKDRSNNHLQTDEYRCAVCECLYDLHKLMQKSKEEEQYIMDCIANLPSKETQDYMYGLEADEYKAEAKRHTA